MNYHFFKHHHNFCPFAPAKVWLVRFPHEIGGRFHFPGVCLNQTLGPVDLSNLLCQSCTRTRTHTRKVGVNHSWTESQMSPDFDIPQEKGAISCSLHYSLLVPSIFCSPSILSDFRSLFAQMVHMLNNMPYVKRRSDSHTHSWKVCRKCKDRQVRFKGKVK